MSNMTKSTTFLSTDNADEVEQLLNCIVKRGIAFKNQKEVRSGSQDCLTADNFVDNLPEDGKPVRAVVDEFTERFLPYCYNFSSPYFMGFPDAGNSIAAISGAVYSDFLQQNMINQSFCSPSGTFAEISVITWLREIVGYENSGELKDIFDAGGVITGGGTTSNAIGIMLARENFRPQTMVNGVDLSQGFKLIVPKGIGHYSVKSGQMWAGCGNNLIEVETKGFRYDLDALKKALKDHEGQIMGLVAYAGDSRTMTVDNFNAIADIVEASGQNIWLHADACHGFSLGFSRDLKHKLDGIERFDSITTDPHKVMAAPYTVSALLVREPRKLMTVASISDLIMQEAYAFGQATPYIGSKPWMSLKLWFAMKNLGRSGFEQIINERHNLAKRLKDLLDEDPRFVTINEVDINSVAFMYKPVEGEISVEKLNELNKAIYALLLKEGKMHLHQFSIPDDGVIKRGATLYPLRFMSGNPNTNEKHLKEMIEYVAELGQKTSEGKLA